MKIVLANKFYYARGGDCIYTMQLEQALIEQGHEVAIFAMQFSENISSQWDKYFPSEVVFSLNKPSSLISTLIRPFGSSEVVGKFNKLLKDFDPDVVHLNNIHTQLSPILAELGKKHGAKIIWTLHDYKLLCPRYDCLKDGAPCEECFSGNKWNAVKNKCVKGSFAGSVLGAFEGYYWSKKRIESSVDYFICPSKFLYEKMIQGGFNKKKLKIKHNAISNIQNLEHLVQVEQYCYVGRISEEKGIRNLIQVASQLPYKLIVMGTGPLLEELKELSKNCEQIQFLGHCSRSFVLENLQCSKFCVLPSEWFENNPLSIIESLMLGTPVLGANIGGIPELISKHKNAGMLFQPGDLVDLKSKIELMWSNSDQEVVSMLPGSHSMSGYLDSLLNFYTD